jgi:hypothetical protein
MVGPHEQVTSVGGHDVEQNRIAVTSGRERLHTTALTQGAHRTCLEAGRTRACDNCVRIVESIIDEAARRRAGRATKVRS